MIKPALTGGNLPSVCTAGFALSFLEFVNKRLFPFPLIKSHMCQTIHRLIVLVEITGEEEIQKGRAEKVRKMDKINSFIT